MASVTRRSFVSGCTIAGAGIASSSLPRLFFASPKAASNREVLVVVFARGGLDGLNLVMPIGGADRGFYEAARPDLKVPTTGTDAALPLTGPFGLHPAAAPLYDLFVDGKLAIVHATGLTEPSRSHFDAMKYLELGTPGITSTGTGWLARHFASAYNLPAEIVMPAISVGSLQATSLQGDHETVNMDDPRSFTFTVGPWQWRDAQRLAMRNLYTSDTTWLHSAALQALDAMDVIELNVEGSYTPPVGVVYPSGSFGNAAKVVAQMVRLGLGLRVATLDIGGWDTHNEQGNGGGGYFAGRIAELTGALAALYEDLDNHGSASRLTIVVQSEFGRRFRQNADRGTDHGHGNVMLVLSGNAIGGVHGSWPGLANEQLFEGADLAVTTDFRRVLSEVLIRRMGNNQLATVFPGYTGYLPLGIVQGIDLIPGELPLFMDDFDGGDLSAWSSTAP